MELPVKCALNKISPLISTQLDVLKIHVFYIDFSLEMFMNKNTVTIAKFPLLSNKLFTIDIGCHKLLFFPTFQRILFANILHLLLPPSYEFSIRLTIQLK
jgi:hypothetical protein